MDDKIAENELMLEKNKGEKCEACFANFHKKLKREKRAYHDVCGYFNVLLQSYFKV